MANYSHIAVIYDPNSTGRLAKMPMQLDGEVAVLPTKSKVTVTVAKDALATLL